MVFVAVSLPTLASNVMSQYSPAIEGNSGLKLYWHWKSSSFDIVATFQLIDFFM